MVGTLTQYYITKFINSYPMLMGFSSTRNKKHRAESAKFEQYSI